MAVVGAGPGTPLPELSDRHRALLERFDARERTALARLISIVEDGRPGFQALLHALASRRSGGGAAGPGTRIGLTGPPGAGKSTLTAELAAAYRERDEEVGIVAVDPTSPFTGGALLGDRIRMNELSTDRGVFIRSMATRGSLGGLAVTTKEVLDVMEAYGFPRIVVETVGVGQAELDVAGATDTVVVVLVPESGDAVQAMKAGLTEIADVFVINKADRPGADRLAREMEVMIRMRSGEALRDVPAHHGVDHARVAEAVGKGAGEGESGAGDASGDAADEGEHAGPEARPEPWEIPVLTTVASTGEGVPGVVEAVDAHREWLRAGGELEARRRRRLESRVREVVERELRRRAWEDGPGGELLRKELDAVVAGDRTPYEVAAEIVAALEA